MNFDKLIPQEAGYGISRLWGYAVIFAIVDCILRVETSRDITVSVKWTTRLDCCTANGWGLEVASVDSPFVVVYCGSKTGRCPSLVVVWEGALRERRWISHPG